MQQYNKLKIQYEILNKENNRQNDIFLENKKTIQQLNKKLSNHNNLSIQHGFLTKQNKTLVNQNNKLIFDLWKCLGNLDLDESRVIEDLHYLYIGRMSLDLDNELKYFGLADRLVEKVFEA